MLQMYLETRTEYLQDQSASPILRGIKSGLESDYKYKQLIIS